MGSPILNCAAAGRLAGLCCIQCSYQGGWRLPGTKIWQKSLPYGLLKSALAKLRAQIWGGCVAMDDICPLIHDKAPAAPIGLLRSVPDQIIGANLSSLCRACWDQDRPPPPPGSGPWDFPSVTSPYLIPPSHNPTAPVPACVASVLPAAGMGAGRTAHSPASLSQL